MVDLVSSPEDMKARRLEARRRRAEREGLVFSERAEDIDPAGEPVGRDRRDERGDRAERREGKLVEFGERGGRKNRKQELVGDAGADPSRPVPEIASSRLLTRLGEIKSKVEVGKVEAKGKARFRIRAYLGFILAVVLPTLAITGYMYLWAVDQYASELRFAVRNSQSSASSMGMSAISSLASTGTATSLPDLADSYIIVEYLQSRDFVEDAHKAIDLSTIYSVGHADWWYRMPREISVEEMVKYMNGMLSVTFDMYTGIVSVKVRAFSAEDAKKVGDTAMKMTENLINKITERARKDVVRDSEEEVARAEQRLKDARTAISKFRDTDQVVDPAAHATAFASNVASLESEATKLKAELNQLTQTMAPTAPRVRVQQSRVEAIEKQIADEKTKIALRSKAGSAISNQLSRYEELITDRDFAQNAYVAALASLERSRMESERNQRYLALFVTPRVAQDSQYPERFRYSFIAFLALFAVWAIVTLIVGSLKDHMS